MGLVETEGIVTKEIKYGDTSRIITLITKDYGKISAIANNVRTGKSKLIMGLSLFVYSDFVLYEGKGKSGSLYRVNEINVKEPFKKIKESIDKMAYASYFADVTNKVVGENNPDTEMMRLLLNSLYFLNNDGADFSLLKPVFEIKTALLCGYAPNFLECANCGAGEDIVYLDPVGGRGCCRRCGALLKQGYSMNETVKGLWEYIQSAGLKSALSVSAKQDTIDYLSQLTEKYLSVQLDSEFKTLNFLKNVLSAGI